MRWGRLVIVVLLVLLHGAAHPVANTSDHTLTLPPIHIERELILQPGETLTQNLMRAGMSARDAHLAAHPLQAQVALHRLRPGNRIRVQYVEQRPGQLGRVEEISFIAPGDKVATVVAQGDTFIAKVAPRKLERVRSVAVGHIAGSLYQSANTAGLPDALVPAFADIFAYELDFTRDIQPGDVFRVVFEDIQDEHGNFVRAGDILAAELVTQGTVRSGYRFEDAHGNTDYYDATGRPKRKLLLRTPLEFSRISSHYNLNRKHPVLGYTRAHRGTDFAAPTGTPVKAAGSGVVERADVWGSFGKYIRIRHNGTYKTAYAHLHTLKVKPGQRVKQGQIIGTVGSTGRSTGPHLHYEVHVNNTQVNPMEAKLPAGNPLPAKVLPQFRMLVQNMQNLWRTQETQLARAVTPSPDL